MQRRTASGAGSASRRPSTSWASLLSVASRVGASSSSRGNPARPHAGEAASHQTGVAAAQAPADPGPGEMAETGRQGLLQLPCRADQQSGAGCIPLLRHRTLATIAQATQSERRHDVAADHAVGQRLAPETGYPSSMAKNTLRRHPPKVGAVCGKAARTVLCGGRSAMSVPTAIASLAMTIKLKPQDPFAVFEVGQ